MSDDRDNRDRDRGDRGGMDFGMDAGMDSGKDGFSGGKVGRGYFRKKVCPFILDKTLLLDYKNLKVVQRFISETGRIVPRHISGVSAKRQRELTRHIKRARNVGLIAPTIEG